MNSKRNEDEGEAEALQPCRTAEAATAKDEPKPEDEDGSSTSSTGPKGEGTSSPRNNNISNHGLSEQESTAKASASLPSLGRQSADDGQDPSSDPGAYAIAGIDGPQTTPPELPASEMDGGDFVGSSESLLAGTECLAEAQPVDELERGEVHHISSPTSDGYYNNRPDSSNDRKTIKFILSASGILLLVLLLPLMLWAGGVFDHISEEAGGGEEQIPQASPDNDNSSARREEYLEQFLPPETLDTIANHSVGGTPQSLAFEWLVKDPSLKLYSEKQLKQRFALATFYYATTKNGTETWLHEKLWLSYHHHECEWSSTTSYNILQAGRKEVVQAPCAPYDDFEDHYHNTSHAHIYHHHDYLHLWQRENNLQGTPRKKSIG